MNIRSYSFGRIEIAGTVYTRDVIVFPARVVSPWWRKEGHVLCTEDLDTVLSFRPEVLIVGTGASGLMRVEDTTLSDLENRGINVIVEATGAAVARYNVVAGPRVVGAFHLTC